MLEQTIKYTFIIAFVAMVFVTSMLVQEISEDLERTKATVLETNQMLKEMTDE